MGANREVTTNKPFTKLVLLPPGNTYLSFLYFCRLKRRLLKKLKRRGKLEKIGLE